MKILIGADVVPTAENADLFRDGDLQGLMGEKLAQRWLSRDHRLFNLECAVTDVRERILKNGPALVAKSECIRGIRAMAPSVVMLCNNHIMDAGWDGLKDLQDGLRSCGIAYMGAGEDGAHTDPGRVLEQDGTRVGLYVCCDREFSAAGKNSPGAHPFSPESFREVRELADRADYVIAVYHGGKEYCRYPSPDLQDRCRRFAEAGADLVLCQHSHCIGAEERYKDSTILYGQGNFIFNKKHDEFWATSLLVEVEAGEGFAVRYLPLIQTEKGTRLAEGPEAEDILAGLRDRSVRMREPGFIDQEFAAFSSSILSSYLYAFAGWNRYLAAVDRKLFHGYFIRRHYSKKQLAAIWNFTATDAHREAVLAGIEQYIRRGGGKA